MKLKLYTKMWCKTEANDNWQIHVLYNYDNKMNPFQQLNIASTFYMLGFDVGYRHWNDCSENDNLYIVGLNQNNITRIQPSKRSYTLHPNYTYDADDYPLSAVITAAYNNTPVVLKIKYQYTP